MSWSQVVARFDPKIANESRAGILVGSRLQISDDPDAALEAQSWASSLPGLELWIVDDLLGLAPRQPIFAGICIRQAFGLDGDYRAGISPAELEAGIVAATDRMRGLLPGLGKVL
jgi:hypothetical protein